MISDFNPHPIKKLDVRSTHVGVDGDIGVSIHNQL
jgi:hypothetical protein